jgi:hypothetical protein
MATVGSAKQISLSIKALSHGANFYCNLQRNRLHALQVARHLALSNIPSLQVAMQ